MIARDSASDPEAGAPLSATQTALVRLSAAVAAGPPEDVARRAEGAIQCGVSPEQIYEMVLQSYLFVGFPRAIEAFFALRPVLADRGGIPTAAAPIEPAIWKRDGVVLCSRVYGRNYDKLTEVIGQLSPDLASSMILEGYGKTLSRPALGMVEREYGIVATLTVTEMWRQLRSHAIGAVNVGGTRAGVKDTISLCAPWCGGAVVRQALVITGLG